MEKENNESNFYCVIPANILYSQDLSEFQKLLYVAITGLTKQSGFCWASNKYFAQKFNKSQTWISVQLNKLKEVGLIDIEIDSSLGNERVIKLKEVFNCTLRPIKENLKTSLRKVKDPSLSLLKHNNIVTNNINNNKTTKNSLNFEIENISENLKKSLIEFSEHRKTLKKPLTQLALNKIIKMLEAYKEDIAIKMINQSIMQGWQGIFELKENSFQKKDSVPAVQPYEKPPHWSTIDLSKRDW